MDSASTTDEALLLRYAAGEVAAFEMLYQRHERPLWRYLLRHGGAERALAEELAQEVWFAVAREAPRFRPDGRFCSWLYAIARHRLIDAARKRRAVVSLDAPVPGTDEPLIDGIADETAANPERQAERAEQGRALLAALAELPEEQREAFVLQVDADLAIDEIATVTGTRFETVKSRLRYARERLRALLREHA
jgi:RNA polymerase sigma factor (sigma-70 family)